MILSHFWQAGFCQDTSLSDLNMVVLDPDCKYLTVKIKARFFLCDLGIN